MIFEAQRRDLAGLAAAGRLRRLTAGGGVDFASNDYIGLARAPRLAAAIADAAARGVPAGSGGSRLLAGNHPEHVALEAEAAAFFGCAATLFVGSGYAANTALLATLPQRGDLIVHDALVHASAHDGMRLGRAERVATPHNDAAAVDAAITRWRRDGGTGTPWIAVESLYSMDGDRAPLDALAAIAARHEAVLLIDEAHATGAWGPDGRGLAAHLDGQPGVVTVKTCGKALGLEGALICGPAIVRDFLVARARPFIFSTAPSPLMAAAVREALRMLADEPGRRAALHALIAEAEARLAPLGVLPTGSQILALIVGDDAEAMRIAAAVQAAGYDVRGIRPPTVPAGTARLRLSLSLHVGPDDLAGLADAIGRAR